MTARITESHETQTEPTGEQLAPHIRVPMELATDSKLSPQARLLWCFLEMWSDGTGVVDGMEYKDMAAKMNRSSRSIRRDMASLVSRQHVSVVNTGRANRIVVHNPYRTDSEATA